jgi:hypothetical protein
VIVDIGVKIETSVQKDGQGIEPSLIQDQSVPVIRDVMEEPSPVDGADRDTGHVSVAEDIIDIVHGENPPEELLEKREPPRVLLGFFLLRSLDQKGDLLRSDRLSSPEGSMRASTDFFQEGGDFVSDDLLPDLLVIGLETGEILFIEKVAERPMTNIMEQTSQTEQFFNAVRRRDFPSVDLRERGVKLLREDSGHMHGPEGVLEAGMFRRGVNPASTLKLEDAAKTLNPGSIDDIPFRLLPLDTVGHQDVVIDRVGNQPRCLNPVGSHTACQDSS